MRDKDVGVNDNALVNSLAIHDVAVNNGEVDPSVDNVSDLSAKSRRILILLLYVVLLTVGENVSCVLYWLI